MGILLASNKEKIMEPIIYEIGIDGESGRDYYSMVIQKNLYIY